MHNPLATVEIANWIRRAMLLPASQSHANSTFPLAAAARDSNCSISATIPLPETELETDDEFKPKKSFLNLKKANNF